MTINQQQDATTELEDNMGYKILDVKADIHEDVEEYLLNKPSGWIWHGQEAQTVQEDILDIVDKHFEKIERC